MASEKTSNDNGRRTKAVIESAGEKPVALGARSAGIPAELKALPRWLCWKYEQRTDGRGRKKWTKVPLCPREGCKASSTDAGTWGTFDEALRFYKADVCDGVGFVFVAGGGLAGIDIDDCRTEATGDIDSEALADVRLLDSYTEISPSGTGVKIIVKAKLPPGGNRKGKIEMYDHGRFFALTGRRVADTPATVNEAQDAIDALHARLFTPRAPRVSTSDTVGARPRLDLTDEALIRRAGAAKNGNLFRQLWEGDIDGYDSHSEADVALCGLLSFWCGPAAERIDRLFRQSGLYRPKWDRDDYRERTITAALAGRTDFYTPPHTAIPRRGHGHKRHVTVTASLTLTVEGRR